MILIFTLDDQNGTNLAGKRQSSDRIVADRILALAGDRLRIKSNTMSFWKNNDTKPKHTAVVQTIGQLAENSMFFAETPVPAELMQAAEQIYVFRWNRRYPSLAKDRVSLEGYQCTILEEFPGYSHEKITLEVYNK